MDLGNFLIGLFTTFALTLTLSFDDFAVGISYGLHKVRLPLKNVASMVLGSAVSTCSLLLIGKFIFTFIPESIVEYIGAIILGVIGCKMLYQGWTKKESYEKYVRYNSISEKAERKANILESFFVGLAMGFDDFAEALGLMAAGFSVVLIVILLEVSQMIVVLSGNYLAFKGLSKRVNGRLSILPGVVLILFVIRQLFFD